MNKILLSSKTKTIPDYPNYSINLLGVVTNTTTGKMIKAFKDKDSYMVINLYNRNGMKTLKIHRLLAVLFIANPQNLPQVNHIDGVKSNNMLSNLEWCTGSSNMKHAHRIGLIPRREQKGENNSYSKLTNIDVGQIRYILKNTSWYLKDIGQLYGVCDQAIGDIKSGKRWGHITDDKVKLSPEQIVILEKLINKES